MVEGVDCWPANLLLPVLRKVQQLLNAPGHHQLCAQHEDIWVATGLHMHAKVPMSQKCPDASSKAGKWYFAHDAVRLLQLTPLVPLRSAIKSVVALDSIVHVTCLWCCKPYLHGSSAADSEMPDAPCAMTMLAFEHIPDTMDQGACNACNLDPFS